MLNIDTKPAGPVVFMGLKSGSAERALQLVRTRAVPDATLHACGNVDRHLAELDARSHVGKPPSPFSPRLRCAVACSALLPRLSARVRWALGQSSSFPLLLNQQSLL